MSRCINIGYRHSAGGEYFPIELRSPYDLFGTQVPSQRFWSDPRLKEIGINRLTELGEFDPIYFIGWEMLADLKREIDLLNKHLGEVDFDAELKAKWLSHLVYAYHLLTQLAPNGSIPELTIG
jgi:hypothetical protein